MWMMPQRVKPFFENDVLHDRVVVVGVDAQVFCCLLAVGNDLAQQAVNLPVAGNRVNRAIRRVGKPGALLDDAVGWVFAENERENAVDCVGLARARFHQLTRGDVRGSCPLPLGGLLPIGSGCRAAP